MKADPNFIYAYDDESDRIILIDAETGQQVDERPNRVVSILQHLKEKGEEDKLRRFAVWCARASNPDIRPAQKKFLEVAQAAVDGEVETEELRRRYDNSEGEAVATDTVGLRQGSARAPGFLASRECVNPDAFAGAANAARFHCLWTEMQQASDQEDDKAQRYFSEIGPADSQQTIARTEQQQVDYLLDLIGT